MLTIYVDADACPVKDEIYRVSYLMQQAGDGSGSHQSGLSRQWDFSVTQEILRAYGHIVKDSIRNVLNAIAVALVALSVAGCSADVTRFNNISFSRAAQSD